MKPFKSILPVRRRSLLILNTFIILIASTFNGNAQEVVPLNDSVVAEKYGLLADSLYDQGKTDSASFYYRLSARYFRKANLPTEEIGCYKMLSVNNLNNPSSMDSLSKTADEFYKRAEELFGDTSKWMVDACIIRAFALKDLARYNEGIESLNKALRIAPVFYDYYHVKTGLIYGNLGIQYHEMGDYAKSIDSYYKALDIDRKLYGENHQTMATNYNNLGIIYSDIGMEDSSIFLIQKAIAIWEGVYGENKLELSDNYTNLAVASLDKGDYYQAILYENKSLKLRLKYLGENNERTALCYSNLGVYYEYAHNYDKALEYQQKSLSIKEKILPAGHPSIAISYLNIASINRNKAKYDEALEYQLKALEINVAVFGKVHTDVAQVLDYMGDIYCKQKKYNESLQTYLTAISIDKQSFKTNRHPKIAGLYNQRAKTFIEMAAYDSAMADIDQALYANNKYSKNRTDTYSTSSDSVFSETILLNSMYLKAKVVYLKYLINNSDIALLHEAYTKHLDAIQKMEEIKKLYMSEESKLFFSDNISDIFQRAVDIAYRIYAIEKTEVAAENLFYLVEKSKSGILQEGLIGAQAAITANIPDSLRLKDRMLSTEIKNLRLNITKLDDAVPEDQNLNKELKDDRGKLIEKQNEYNLFIQELEQDYPRYKALKYGVEYTKLANLKKSIDEKTLLVDYFLSDSSLYILAIDNTNISIQKVETDSTFTKSVENYLKSIKRFEPDQFFELSYFLNSKLMEPVQDKLNSKPHLVIIPDKTLFYLPFETLCSDKTSNTSLSKANYLIKNHDVRYHYSAAMFCNSISKSAGQQQLKNSFLGFAPVFASDSTQGYVLAYNNADSLTVNETLRMVSADGKKLNELIYTEKEVREIESLFENKKYPAKAYFSSTANEETFRQVLGNYKYVHIATHGLLNESEPNLSGLVFAPSAENKLDTTSLVGLNIRENNGILYTGEISTLNMNANLLVLSACETGTGRIYNGEGVMSLTRGFLATGVPNVVLSLWKVGDYSTMELMVKFYSNFLEGETYSEALQQAKIQLMTNEMYAFPKYWGAFVLIGTNK